MAYTPRISSHKCNNNENIHVDNNKINTLEIIVTYNVIIYGANYAERTADQRTERMYQCRCV